MAQDLLQTSRQTLEELHWVCIPGNGPAWDDRTKGFARFGALRSLTLCEWVPPCTEVLARLPLSLQELTIAARPGLEDIPFFSRDADAHR